MIRPSARSRSMYERDYLRLNELRWKAGRKPLTPKSFIGRVLQGSARLHSSQYADALIGRLLFLRRAGAVVEVPSARGKASYLPAQLAMIDE